MIHSNKATTMNEATLFSHCIVCTNGSVCSEPSPMYNGVCANHSHDYAGLVSNYWRLCDPSSSYYFSVFKSTFEKCLGALFDKINSVGVHKRLKTSQTVFLMLSKHRHYVKMFRDVNAITRTKLFVLIGEVQGLPVFTSNEKITYAQNMKTYYHDIFPYDNHEFNL